MSKEIAGRIFELSNDRKILGRRKIKLVLHEIFATHDKWQDNGISWDEAYTRQNLESVTNMSLCVEFLSEERRLPYGHGLTDIRDNMPLFEDATVVGHFDKGYITDIEFDGETKRVLVAEGYIDEMRYPKFVEWLQERMEQDGVKGSVEIVGRPENDNRIIYDGGWKEKGRIPQIYDYSGHCILGIKPADDAAIVMELNNKANKHKEDTTMDEKTMGQFVDAVKDSVTQTITELNSKNAEYEGKISELNGQLADKDAEIAELNEKLSAAQADVAAKDQTIADQAAELNSLKETNATLEKDKKLAELNSALAEFTPEEQALAQAEIDAFKADPTSVELNSITSKICVEMVRKNKEAHTNEQNNAPDIYGGVNDPGDVGDVDIFG